MRTVVAVAIAAAPFAVVMSAPAEGQSFLQSLFGGGQGASSGPPSYPGGGMVVPQRPLPRWARDSNRTSRRTTGGAGDWSDADRGAADRGKYRTLCVRTCDGYYFPISNAVTRSRFTRDGAQCRASCGEAARLYYMPSTGDDVSVSLDLAGRAYTRLPNAFKYRKSLVDGCACKPDPWSEAELQRHRAYAASSETAAGQSANQAAPGASAARMAGLAHVDGSQPDADVDDGDVRQAAGERPQPIGVDEDTMAAKPSAVVPPRHAPARWRTPDRPVPRRQPAAARTPQPAAGYSGLGAFLVPGGKYTWPGDKPRR